MARATPRRSSRPGRRPCPPTHRESTYRKAAAATCLPRKSKRTSFQPARFSLLESFLEVSMQRVAADAILLHRIARSHGHAAVLQRFVVDRDAQRRADFVLPAVELPDVSFIVLRSIQGAQTRLDVSRALYQLGLVARERKNGYLNRGYLRVETQHAALGFFPVRIDAALSFVCVDHERQHGAIDSGRAFDQQRRIMSLGGLIKESQILAGKLHVGVQVVGAAVSDRFQLAPAPRKKILDVDPRL